MMQMDRYYATTRQLTGLPYIHYAYVYDRMTGKPIMACKHNHATSRRSKKPGQRLAQECADRMLRQVLARTVT